jgi:hypothetical protein
MDCTIIFLLKDILRHCYWERIIVYVRAKVVLRNNYPNSD